MPVPWFTVEEEKPDIGTVIFKADDYYERLQHITGMWNDNKFLHYEMFKSPQESESDEEPADPNKPKPVDPSTLYDPNEISNVPQLLAYLDRANMRGALPSYLLDFMWDLHKLYIRKMTEFGFATRWMSQKEFAFLENREKWTKLVKAMVELEKANKKEEEKFTKRKRMLKPTALKVFTRLEDLLNFKITKKGSLIPLTPNDLKLLKKKQKARFKKLRRKTTSKVKRKTKDGFDKEFALSLRDKEVKKLQKRIDRSGISSAFFNKPETPFSWDYGKTRQFDRKHVRVVGKHIEFTRFYHKIAKALRFSQNEPVDWRTITLEEIDKHRFACDCWMAIKGRVYDITEWLVFHPGGSKLIMQGVGIDATGIFVAVHPYVVFYKYLAGKQIGTLPNYEDHPRTEWEPPRHADFNVFHLLKKWYHRKSNKLDKWKPKTNFEQSDTEYTFTVTFPRGLVSRLEDWTITIIDGFRVTVVKHVETPYVWYGGFDLRTKVMDDTAYRTFSDDFNSVSVKIAKSYKVRVKRPIKDWRQDDGFFLSSYSLKDMYRASVVERTPLVDGVKLYGISVGMNKFIGCPVGCYVNLRILDETRPYTPVCLTDEFEDKFKEESGDFQTLYFIIKEFKDGNFTSMLHHLPVKKILEGVDIFVSPAMGNFKLDFLLSNVDVMILIPGGTGISVMTRIIQEYVQRKEQIERDGKAIILIQFAQYREDLIWKNIWMEMDKKYKWFHYFYSLTRVYRYVVMKEKADKKKERLQKSKDPRKAISVADAKKKDEGRSSGSKVLEFDSDNPQEMYGYPAVSKMEHVFEKTKRVGEKGKLHKACVCGPYGFNHSCELMLREFGKHEEGNVHYFAG